MFIQENHKSVEPFKATASDKRSLIEVVFGSIFNDVLNDPSLTSDVRALEQENLSLCDEVDTKSPVWLGLPEPEEE